MFNKLIASAPGQRSWLRNPTVIFVSIVAHLLVLAGVVWATTGGEAEVEEAEPEQVTYIDITELPAPDPEELFEASAEPEEPPAAEETPPAATPTPPAPRRVPRSPAHRSPQPHPVKNPQASRSWKCLTSTCRASRSRMYLPHPCVQRTLVGVARLGAPRHAGREMIDWMLKREALRDAPLPAAGD
jgi:hypothetical protein